MKRRPNHRKGVDQEWITIDRPGYFGSRRNKILRKLDSKYGKGNHRVAWDIGCTIVEKEHALMLYEDAYYEFFKNNPKLLAKLIESARNVYDNSKTNLKSGLDYGKQENHSNHYQDIAIRRVLTRLGKSFRGGKLIQIRHGASTQIGKKLSPGRVPFHLPELVCMPVLSGWWQKGSVEEFWQSNKVLQVKSQKRCN